VPLSNNGAAHLVWVSDLDRHAFEYAGAQGAGRNVREAKPSGREERCPGFLGVLCPTCPEQHGDIEQLGIWVLVRRSDHVFEHEQPRVRRADGAYLAENLQPGRLVKAIEDRLQDIRRIARRYSVKEAPAHDGAPRCHSGTLQRRGRLRYDVWLVEEQAAHTRVIGQQRREKGTGATAQVGHRGELPEVIRRQEGVRPEPRVGVLGAVEEGVFFGMGGAPLPDALPLVQLWEGGLARLDAVEQVRPHLPIRRPADVGRVVSHRFGRVGAQAGTHLREGEAALVILVKDPHGREGTQQPVERRRIDGEGGGQGGGTTGAIAEAVGNAECRRHVDRLGHLIAINQPMQTDRWPFFVWRHTWFSEKGSVVLPCPVYVSVCQTLPRATVATETAGGSSASFFLRAFGAEPLSILITYIDLPKITNAKITPSINNLSMNLGRSYIQYRWSRIFNIRARNALTSQD
jgi:hypothetical protein